MNTGKRFGATVLALVMIVALLSTIMPQTPGFILHPNAQFVSNAPSSLSLGFSPTTLSPLQDGVPVYSLSDQMWAESISAGPVSVSVVSPGGVIISSSTLNPSTVEKLYSFQPSDQEGIWSLEISSESGPNTVQVNVVNPNNHSFALSLVGYSLQNGNVNLGFNSSGTEDYNIQGCVVPHSGLSTVQVSIPTSVGAGSVNVDARGNYSTIGVSGIISNPFSYWFELYYSYSYSNQNSQFVSRELRVAQSTAQLFSATSQTSQNISINYDSIPRDGRYTLRSYFDSGQGLSVVQSSVLFTQDTLLWLDPCAPFPISPSSSFHETIGMTGSPGSWPAALYYMYDFEGVDGVTLLPLNLNFARLAFISDPGRLPITRVDYSVQNSPSIEASSAYLGSVYLASNRFPVDVGIIPRFGSVQLDALNVTVPAPFANYTVTIRMSELSVSVVENGAPLKGASIQVLDLHNDSIVETSGTIGNATFIVPPGEYTLKASFGNLFGQAQTNASLGIVSRVSLNLFSQSTPSLVPSVLIGVAVIGLLFNAYIWIARRGIERFRSIRAK